MVGWSARPRSTVVAPRFTRRLCPELPIPVPFPPHSTPSDPRRPSEPPPWHDFCNAIPCHGRIPTLFPNNSSTPTPHDFVRFALQRTDIERVEVLDTEQPTVRRTDSLLHVSLGDGEEVLVHHEFQTTDSTDPPMPQRMAAYIGYYIGQYGLPIHSTVIYLRPDAGRHDPGYYVQERPGYRVLVQYKVIRLIELDGQGILERGTFGFAAVLRR